MGCRCMQMHADADPIPIIPNEALQMPSSRKKHAAGIPTLRPADADPIPSKPTLKAFR
jgi:hypothetical protein